MNFMREALAFKNILGLFLLWFAYSTATIKASMLLLSILIYTNGILTPSFLAVIFMMCGLYVILAPFDIWSLLAYCLPIGLLALLLAIMALLGNGQFFNTSLFLVTLLAIGVSYGLERLTHE